MTFLYSSEVIGSDDRNKPKTLESYGCRRHGKLKYFRYGPKLTPRWVVSNKFWTSSGVTAGLDMAAAFVRYWVELHVGADEGKKISDDLLGVTEVMYVFSSIGLVSGRGLILQCF